MRRSSCWRPRRSFAQLASNGPLMRIALAITALAAALACAGRAPAAPALVLWAWERPEDLSSAPSSVEVAAVEGFVQLSGDHLWGRARRFPLKTAPGARRIAVVHAQIDTSRPLEWSLWNVLPKVRAPSCHRPTRTRAGRRWDRPD